MKERVMQENPYAVNSYVWFDECSGTPKRSVRSALLYKLSVVISFVLSVHVSLGDVTVQNEGVNQQPQNLSVSRSQTSRSGTNRSFELESLCGFTFFQKHKGKLFASPVKDSLGFIFPAKKHLGDGEVYLEKVRLRKPFRVFKDAILCYNSEYELINIELSHVMPKGTTQDVAINELTSAIAVMEQKYNIILTNRGQISATMSSLKLNGAQRRTCAWYDIGHKNGFIVAQCDKWVKTPPPLYQGHKPKSSEYFVLTIKAKIYKKKLIKSTTPKHIDTKGIDAL